ncbi:MAG: PaaI family thioesterase [Maricaulaceae bacterium]
MTHITETEGEFAGWQTWPDEVFEYESAGPFYFKELDGDYVSRFRAARKHMNAGGVMHGGCLMSFADFSLFAIAAEEMEGIYGATVAFNCEFLQGPVIGDLMEARGEVLRAGKSIIFVRGIITGEGKPCLNFSGTIKKFKPRA